MPQANDNGTLPLISLDFSIFSLHALIHYGMIRNILTVCIVECNLFLYQYINM